jgi:hypothetical protein
MTRDEALEKLSRPPYDPDLIRQDFEYIATKLGISAQELEGFHQMPLKNYWDYKNRASFFKLGERILAYLASTKRGGAY